MNVSKYKFVIIFAAASIFAPQLPIKTDTKIATVKERAKTGTSICAPCASLSLWTGVLIFVLAAYGIYKFTVGVIKLFLTAGILCCGLVFANYITQQKQEPENVKVTMKAQIDKLRVERRAWQLANKETQVGKLCKDPRALRLVEQADLDVKALQTKLAKKSKSAGAQPNAKPAEDLRDPKADQDLARLNTLRARCASHCRQYRKCHLANDNKLNSAAMSQIEDEMKEINRMVKWREAGMLAQTLGNGSLCSVGA